MQKNITPDGRAVLETAINGQLETVCQEMQSTKRRWGKPGAFWAIIWSFLRPWCRFARRLLDNRYEAVIPTHLDHAHIHNHVLYAHPAENASFPFSLSLLSVIIVRPRQEGQPFHAAFHSESMNIIHP